MPSLTRTKIPFHPWLYFFIFIISNVLLSYFHFPIQANIGIGLVGLVLPLGIVFKKFSPPPKSGKSLHSLEFLPSMPLWVWLGMGVLAVFIRFYKLTSLSSWPLMDEGVSGFEAMNLSEDFSFRFFYSAAQIPPLYFWALGCFFKMTSVSLESLWFFPALISLFLIPAAFWAYKIFFSRSIAWICAFFFALSFWPFYLGRFSMPHGLLILWELLTFAGMGLFLKASSKSEEKKMAALLGLGVGGGFYTEFHWPLIAAVVTLIVIAKVITGFSKNKLILIWFLSPVFLISFPLAIAAFHEGCGRYFSMLLAFGSGDSWISRFKMSRDYFSSLFWGVQTLRHGYKPFWGGYLNPILDSCFLLGLMEIYRFRKSFQGLFLSFGLFVFMLPGLLTRELELFRLVLIMPLLFAVAAWGLAALLVTISLRARIYCLIILLTTSVALDFYHLLGPYQQSCHSDYETFNSHSRSFERWKAYEFLKNKSQKSGPGLIFDEFEPTPFNQTLALAVYPFNAARNLNLSEKKASWVGFLTNIHYAPFLSKEFPRVQWFELAPQPFEPQENLILGMIDFGDAPIQYTFVHWLKVEQALRRSTFMTLNLGFGQSHEKVLNALLPLSPLVGSDRFLRSNFEERIFYNAMADSDTSLALQSLDAALQAGYPAAHLYNNLGVLWFTLGGHAKARQNFLAAIHSPLDHSSAAINLSRVP